MSKKTIDFRTSISDVKQVDPLFSTCKVRVLYTGRNRNMSIIEKKAVENALPTLLNKPIIGEYSVEKKDWKGHGGAIDMDSYDFIHTTKPYGLVPESATFEWETVGGREYLTVHGCLLWTGRYSEAYSIIEKAKGQSMEIEVTGGEWVEDQEAYRIDSFIFSALCILGDDVSPAFEDASISAYSLKNATFQQEMAEMMNDLKASQNDKEGTKMEKLKELLVKYSTTVEVLTAKGIVFSEISEDELEGKIVEALGLDDTADNQDNSDDSANADNADNSDDADNADGADAGQTDDSDNADGADGADAQNDGANDDDTNAGGNDDQADNSDDQGQDNSVDVEALENRITELEGELSKKDIELNSLREFKLNIEKKDHADKVTALFTGFQITEDDVKDLDIHAFSYEEIEEKCYAIIGRKMAQKKNFSQENNGGLRLPLTNTGNDDDQDNDPVGNLINKYKNK